MRSVAAVLLLFAVVAGGCASPTSSEAAWRRGQCEQIIDAKMREKCLERVD